MVASMIRNREARGPLLLLVAQAQYGCEDEVVYAPDHQLKVLKHEIEEFLGTLSARADSEVLGQNMAGKTTVGGVRAFLTKLSAVVEEGIADKKGLFVVTD